MGRLHRQADAAPSRRSLNPFTCDARAASLARLFLVAGIERLRDQLPYCLRSARKIGPASAVLVKSRKPFRVRLYLKPFFLAPFFHPYRRPVVPSYRVPFFH